MARKPITLTDIERRNAELDSMLTAVREERDLARDQLRESRQEANQLRRSVDELRGNVERILSDNADLQRRIGQLEGYRARVERVDDLDRGRQPVERVEGGRPDMAIGHINPHYREPRDGFFQR